MTGRKLFLWKLGVAIVSLLGAVAAQSADDFEFWPGATYDSNVPTSEQVLGHAPGERIAEATPPAVSAVDTTGAGDTFTAALTLAMVEQQSPNAALQFACAAGAAATTRMGAQPSLPFRDSLTG